MPAQSFFYETSHANFGLMFDENDNFDALENLKAELQNKATQLDQSDNTIYRVIFQASSNGNGLQIFVAPYYRYSEIAELTFDEFKHNSKAYITDKKLVKRQIKKKSFLEEMRKITRDHGDNKKQAIKLTVQLIKQYYEKEYTRLNAELEKIAHEYNMGVVKFQEHYAGLADTWIEYPNQHKQAV